jgi:hypothetical protein
MDPRIRKIRRPATVAGGSLLAAFGAVLGLIMVVTGCGSQASTGMSPGSGTSLTDNGGSSGGSSGHAVQKSSHRPAAAHHAAPGQTHQASQAATSDSLMSTIGSGAHGGALFGGTAPLVKQERKLGRKLAIVREYYSFGEHFPTATDARFMAGHRTLLISLDGTGGKPTFASVAAGNQDGYLRSFLKAVNAAAARYHLGPIYIDYQHEPNLARTLGTPAEFIKAWDHIHQLAADAHLNWQQGGHLHWVLIMTHRTYIPMGSRELWAKRMGSAWAYWPGNNEVDVVAADGYDSPGCKAGTTASGFADVTPASVFDPTVSFARTHGGLPVFLAEWAGSAKFPSAQLKFIREMPGYIASHPSIDAAMYWDSAGSKCSYTVDNNPMSIAALGAMGHQAALQGQISG